jgi:hypothetical protein
MPFLAFTNNNSALGRTPFYVGATNRDVYAWGAQFNEGSTAQTYASASSVQVGSGYVTTWYDQTGNARNATNVVGGAPIIINYGGIKRSGTRPTIYFENRTDSNLLSTGYTVSQPNTIIVVAQNKSTSTLGRNIFIGIGGAQGNQRLIAQGTTGFLAIGSGGANAVASTTAIGTILRSYFLTFNGASTQLYTNNTSIIGPTSAGNGALTSASIGSVTGSNPIQGGISEIIFYGSNQTSNQLGIESNLNSYYTIY